MTDRQINKIARLEIPTVKPEDLTIGQKYRIMDLKTANTKYGKKVLATLNNECIIFLPSRVSIALVTDPEEYMYHTSKVEEGHLHIRFLEGTYHQCEFVYDTE